MNIFILDKEPLDAAKMLCDCHLRREDAENAEIIGNVHEKEVER